MASERRRRPLTREEALRIQERRARQREKEQESRELARGPIDLPFFVLVVLLTVIGALLASAITGGNFAVAGTSYVNLSMFLAFALLFPNTQVLLMFIIPVKMKWLAYIDVGLFAVGIVRAILAQNWGGVILPVMALLNFLIFAWPTLQGWAQRKQYQHSRQAVNFKKAVHQQQKQQGYHHKCAVCGRTDTDYPDLQFRYCSKCVGYHCFCQDHIFSHVHFTE